MIWKKEINPDEQLNMKAPRGQSHVPYRRQSRIQLLIPPNAWLTNIFFVVIALLIISGLYIAPPLDNDFGWHYKYGEYFFANNKLLKENIFSYRLTDYQWANSYWLSQIYIYFLYSLGNNLIPQSSSILLSYTGGLIITSLIYFISYKFLKNKNQSLVVCLLYALTLTYFIVTVRPLFWSSVFMLLLIYILARSGEVPYSGNSPAKNIFIVVPLIFLIWANTHADFILGLFVVGVFSLEKIFTIIKAGYRQNPFLNKSLWIWVILPIVSVLITIINPYGINLWLTMLKEIFSPQFAIIAEWLPLDTTETNARLVTFFVLLSIYVFSFLKSYKKLPIWYKIIFILFFILGVRSVYFIRTFTIIGSYAVLELFGSIKNDLDFSKFKINTKKISIYFYSALSIVAVLTATTNIFYITNESKWSDDGSFPMKAVNFIKSDKPKPNMFNEYNWGGYLIWKLPKYKVYIDGRMTNWNTRNAHEIKITQDIYSGNVTDQELREIIENYNIGFFLLFADSNLTKNLDRLGWARVYSDETAAVYYPGN